MNCAVFLYNVWFFFSYYFARRANELVLDVSGSMNKPLVTNSSEQAASPRRLDAAVDFLQSFISKRPGDAVVLGCARLRGRSAESGSIVVVSYEASNTGAVTPQGAADIARRLGIRVYTVGGGIPVPGQEQEDSGATRDVRLLRTIAARTGGRFFRVTDSGDLRACEQLIVPLIPRATRLPPVRFTFLIRKQGVT